MKVLVRTVVVLVAVLIFGLAVVFPISLAARPSGQWARYVTTVSIPSPFKLTRNFVDYMTVSEGTLYGAYMNHGLAAAVDMRAERVIATVPDLGKVHGVAIDSDHGLGFVSDGSNNSVAVFDLSTHKVLKKIALSAEEPDAILYDQKAKLVYVANGKSASGSLIDPVTQTVVANVPLAGEGPEFCQADPSTGLIYQNLEETDEVVVVDPFKRLVIARFPLPKGQSPTGLALDVANHRLFVTGTHKQLVVLNAQTGAIVATLPIGSISDGVGYDPGLRRVYTANFFGSMTVIRQDSPDQYSVIENMKTRFGGHSVTVDPVTHRIYVASFGSILVYDAVANMPQ